MKPKAKNKKEEVMTIKPERLAEWRRISDAATHGQFDVDGWLKRETAHVDTVIAEGRKDKVTRRCPYQNVTTAACPFYAEKLRIARWRPRRWAWPLAASVVVWALAQVAVAWVLARDDDRARIIGMECGPETSGRNVWFDVDGERLVNDNANFRWAMCRGESEHHGATITIARNFVTLEDATQFTCPAVLP